MNKILKRAKQKGLASPFLFKTKVSILLEIL
jgi:hypothetical protein